MHRLIWSALLGLVLVVGLFTLGLAATPEVRSWEGLRLAPPRPVNTLGPESTFPAPVATDQQLLLGELFSGGVYLSELDPETLKARWTRPVAAAIGGRERTGLTAARVGRTVWLAWLEAPAGTAAGVARSLMLAGYDLDTKAVTPPSQVASTRQGAIAAHNQQLWLAWLGSPESNSLSLSSGPGEGGFVVSWPPPTPGSLQALGLADFGADLVVPFVTEARGQDSLWTASYNGHRFYGVRKLRGSSSLGPPASAHLSNRLLTLCSLFTGPQGANPNAASLVLTATDRVGVNLASTDYLADGNTNLNPGLAAAEKVVWVAYNAWTAPAGTTGARNLGLFLGKIEIAL